MFRISAIGLLNDDFYICNNLEADRTKIVRSFNWRSQKQQSIVEVRRTNRIVVASAHMMLAVLAKNIPNVTEIRSFLKLMKVCIAKIQSILQNVGGFRSKFNKPQAALTGGSVVRLHRLVLAAQ